MIAQHHERLNGTGLPLGLQEDEISLLSQIVMVVDEYDDLCNLSENRHHVTPHEILSQMYRDVTINKIHAFNGEILVPLIQLLGVYPPGTLVELNDGKMGVVVNINAINRSKPQVLCCIRLMGDERRLWSLIWERMTIFTLLEVSLQPLSLQTFGSI